MVHFFSSATENAANKVMPRISMIMVFVVPNLMFYSSIADIYIIGIWVMVVINH